MHLAMAFPRDRESAAHRGEGRARSRNRRPEATRSGIRPEAERLPALPYTLLDVFTGTPLEGNGLAVVHDADALDEETMLGIARETRLSETAFVRAPTPAGADYRNRIFTVAGELPFAGHPSLGTAVAVARRRGLAQTQLIQQTGAGLQPVAVEADLAGTYGRASMLQEPARFGPEVEAASALAAAGLTAADADPRLSPQVVSTGMANVIAPVADASALARTTFDPTALAALLEPLGATVLYVAWWEPARGRARARGFFDGGEDPATGSAAGALLAMLADRRGVRALEITQGVEMGRPSRIETATDGDRVRVGGDVVVLVERTLRL
jgi:trans-2,3-dihydro-3-hydroxyanthranilate isomerase